MTEIKDVFMMTAKTPQDYWAARAELGCLYVLRSDAQQVIKVGHSKNPELRLIQLQIGCCHQLRFLARIAAGREMEKYIHAVLRSEHLRGEWFYDGDEVCTNWFKTATKGALLDKAIWRFEQRSMIFARWDAGKACHVNSKTGESVQWDDDLQGFVRLAA